MNKKSLIVFAVFMAAAAASFAQTARDADIDAQLNAGAMAGIAPPTGSQALSAKTAGTQTFADPYLPAAVKAGKIILGQTDGAARVYAVTGTVVFTSKGSPAEKKLFKNQILRAGDKIATEAGASVSIAFDESYQNAVHIPENTRAIIESIEPTSIKIENGSIYSAVDGLPQGSTWKVSAPPAVAAVRGTLYLVRYIKADGSFFAATVNVPDDGKSSAIDIQQVNGDGSADVPEGKEIFFREGETPDQSLVGDLDPSQIEQILKFFEELKNLREEGGNAPPTNGEFFEPNNVDPAGPGTAGGDTFSYVDPRDLDVIPDEEVPPAEESSGGEREEVPCQYECYQD